MSISLRIWLGMWCSHNEQNPEGYGGMFYCQNTKLGTVAEHRENMSRTEEQPLSVQTAWTKGSCAEHNNLHTREGPPKVEQTITGMSKRERAVERNCVWLFRRRWKQMRREMYENPISLSFRILGGKWPKWL